MFSLGLDFGINFSFPKGFSSYIFAMVVFTCSIFGCFFHVCVVSVLPALLDCYAALASYS